MLHPAPHNYKQLSRQDILGNMGKALDVDAYV